MFIRSKNEKLTRASEDAPSCCDYGATADVAGITTNSVASISAVPLERVEVSRSGSGSGERGAKGDCEKSEGDERRAHLEQLGKSRVAERV